MILNARVSPNDTRRYVLLSNGSPVGWIGGGVIGFEGFSDVAAARRASSIAAGVLAGWYRARWRTGALLPWEAPDDADSHVVADGVIVGRLSAPSEQLPDASAGARFELRVPAGLWIATTLELAQRIWAALAGSGIVHRSLAPSS